MSRMAHKKNCFVQNTKYPHWGDVHKPFSVERQTSLWLGFAMCCLVLFLHFSGWTSYTPKPNDSFQMERQIAGTWTESSTAPPSRWSGTRPVAEKGKAGRCRWGRGQRVKGGCPTSAWFCSYFLLLAQIFFFPLISQVLYYSRVPRVLSE